MKKSIKFLIILVTILYTSIGTTQAQAPSYKNFEWEVFRLGYGSLLNSDIQKGSIALGTEVRYNISDFYSLGIAGDAIVSMRNVSDGNADLEIASNTSLIVDRYFSNSSPKRAFLGASFGYYESYKQLVRDDKRSDRFDEASSFGFGLRGGYELKRFRFTAQYLHSTSTDALNAFTLTVGLTLWGDYKVSSD